MCSIEKMANFIAYKIAIHLKLGKDHEEVLMYGAFNILQTLWAVFWVMVFGMLFGVLIEALIISVTMATLRKYSGGVHAASPNQCAFLGAIVSVGFAVLLHKIEKFFTPMNMAVFVGGVFIFAYYMFYKYAPVDSPNKPIKKEEKRKKLKRNAIKTLFMFLLINILLAIFNSSIWGISCRSSVAAITIGVFWQSFTLTSLGHLLIYKVDAFLRKVSTLVGGEKA